MSNQTLPLVSLIDNEPRTTTLAIADGMNVEHKAVIQLVRTYQADLEEFGPLAFEMVKGKPLPQGGFAKATEFAKLNEQQSTLIMTYMKNTEIARTFKMRLVKAFYELARNRHTDPYAVLNDPAAMRGVLLTYVEKVISLEATVTEQKALVESMNNWGSSLVAQVTVQEQQITERDKMIAVVAPKAAALDQIALADGTLSLSDAAKTIGVQPQKVFIPRLCSEKWIFRRAGGDHWIAYQDKLQQMLLEHKVTTISRGDGSEKITEQVRITPKGLAKLAVLFQGGVK